MNQTHWTPHAHHIDFVGNNAAFTCPHCFHVFLVSAVLHPLPGTPEGHQGRRACPSCRGSVGNVDVGVGRERSAWVEW